MVDTGYSIAHLDDVPVLRMAEVEEVDDSFDRLGVQNLDEEQLHTEEMKVKVWHVPPDERMGTHGHPTQEEFYYVLDGTFRLQLGEPGDTESFEVAPGTVFAASPGVARGYENVGGEEGRVLVVAAPNVAEGGIPESELDD